MCSNPISVTDEQRGSVTFACRVCNECIAARKNDWVARAMAEKAVSGETIGIELTYRNTPDGDAPDAAKAFRYSDVADFLKRLREEYFRQYNARGEIRFICAGERGSQKGRVHWHMIIFADRPFTNLGAWSDFLFAPLDGPKFSELGRKAHMLHWRFWPHGHVVVKRPDQGGMQYVLKYALKDQFNVVKSKGTMRFSKAENHGASYFRMSKQPPLGFRFLQEQCDRWEQRGAVPVKLELSIPEYKGFWWPKAKQREYLLDRLYLINEGIKERTGRDAPQWDALLASLVSVEKDWEALVYGPETEETEEFDAEAWAQHLALEQSRRERDHREAERRSRCGGIRVCRLCWRGKSKEAQARYHDWYNQRVAEFVTDTQTPALSIDHWYRLKKQTNPHCIPSEVGCDN